MYNDFKRLRRLFNEVKNIVFDLGGVFYSLLQTLTYTHSAFQSMWNGKIGGVARFFCFDSNTLIDMNNGTQIPIWGIAIGDEIKGGKVTSLLKFDSKYSELYNYNDIIVSGNHLVYELDQWVRIKDSYNSIKLNGYNGRYIYCLCTDSNLIYSNGIKFADYIETNNLQFKKDITKLLLSNINYMNDDKQYYNIDDAGFHPDTLIDIQIIDDLNSNNKMNMNVIQKPISDVKIGDTIKGCGKVIGRIKMIPPKYIYYYNNIICSGSIITEHYVNNVNDVNINEYKDELKKWEQIETLSKYKYVNGYDIFYNLITESNKISIDGRLYRDYEIINNKGIDSKIDIMSSNILNNT